MRTHPFLPCLLSALIYFIIPFNSIGQANNNNGSNIDLNFVRFNMAVNPNLAGTDANFLNAAVTYYFKTTQASVNKIKFDLMRNGGTGNFNPHSVTVDNIRYHNTTYTSNTTRSNDTLIVTLPVTIAAANTQDSVTITYHGAPYQNTGSSRGYYKTSVTSGNMATSHSAGFYARQWWPCKHNMTDKIDSVEFVITSPSAYTAVGNGVLLNGPTPATDVNGNKTWRWKTRYLIAHYLIAFAVHPYVIYNSPAAVVNGTSVPIMNFLTNATNNATVRNNCDAMKPVIEYFSTVFGDYPFKNEKYGHVTYTFGGGMENQTASYFGEGTLNATDRSTMAHELAHQWFGDRVTCSKWNNNWVNEGFARHAELTYNEQFVGVSTANTKRASYKTSGQSASATVYRYDVEVVNVADHGSKIFPSNMVYDKASIVVAMLRRLVGDVKFYQTLRNYLSDPLVSYGYATTEDIRRHFEATSGKDLTAFFDDFIYKAGYPTYKVDWAFSASQKRVALKLTQTAKTSSGTYALPAAARFHTVLPVRLRKTSLPQKDTVVAIFDDGVASLSPLFFNTSFNVEAIEVDPYSESYSFSNTLAFSPGLVLTLPVNLVKFDAYKKEEEVKIVWESNNETEFSGYEVEHSANGLAFSKIGGADAKNQSVNQYEVTHALPASGYNYYRLKMIDKDGKFQYSMVATVIMPALTKVKIAPNPANSIVRITIPHVNTDVPVKLINLQGQVMEITGMKAGESTLELDVRSVPAGNYWLEMQLNGSKIVERILIQH